VTLVHLLLIAASAAAVVLLWYQLRLIASVPPFQLCDGCRDPLVSGFEAIHDRQYLCRKCCRSRGIQPWYYPNAMWEAEQARKAQGDRPWTT
jgi:hypothetical protein